MKELKIDFYNPTNLKSYDLNETMRYQLAILGSLDVFTRVHSENVANLTCRICEYLNMKRYFTIYCTICAYLHDVGKQFIPSSILQKNGKLTNEEYDIIKTHTTIGYEICMKDEKLRPYSYGALYHHESLNGTGYPNQLEYENIPIEGQIIRVADEFDAITSKRQYKTHIGICDTLNILIDETKFDKKNNEKFGKINPKIVKALIKVVKDDTEYEIYNLSQYLNYLFKESSRLNQIKLFEEKMNLTTKTKDKEYYFAIINSLLSHGETLENFKQILEEYNQAYNLRKEQLQNLKIEFKKIKKLKV